MNTIAAALARPPHVIVALLSCFIVRLLGAADAPIARSSDTNVPPSTGARETP